MRPTLLLLFLFFGIGSSAQQITYYLPHSGAVSADNHVNFKWKRNPSVSQYTLQLSSDNLFTAPQEYMSAQTQITVDNLNAAAFYWWRVKGDNGPWGEVRTLQTIDLQNWPGLAFWFRADSGITAQNGQVSQWQNMTSGSTAATQPTASLQPTYVANSFNGLPAVRFGKANALPDATYLTFPSQSFPGGTFTMLSVWDLISNNPLLQYAFGGTNQGIFAGGTVSGLNNTGAFDGTTNYQATGGINLALNQTTLKRNAVWRDGLSLPISGTPINSLNINALGARPDLPGILFMHALLPEVVIFQGDLPNPDRLLGQTYLQSKYARPVQLPYDTNVCGPGLVLSLPGGTDEYASITWSNGATTPSINITSNGTYWVRGISRLGGYQTSDTIRVKGIFSKPEITPDLNQTFCFNRDTIVFRKVSNTPGVTYTWQNGSIDDSISVISGSEVFITAFDPPSGCFVSSDTILLTHKTKADFANPAVCPGVNVLLQDLSLDLAGDTVNSWSWNFGDPATNTDISSDTNGVWNYANSGNYTVYLKVTTSDGCADSITKNLLVKPSATPNFNWQGLCYGKPTQFFDQSTPESGTQVTGYQWNFGPGINSSFVNPAVVYDTANTYPVSLKIFTASGCNETIIRQVPVNKGVNAAFDLADSLCANQNINVLDQSEGVNDNIVSWVWRFGSNTPVSGQSPSFAFQNTGSRIVRLTTVTSAGCMDSIQQNVFVKPAASANFALAVNGGTPPFRPEVTNLTNTATSYAWYIDGALFSNEFTPVFPSYADTGTHTVTLVVENAQGCSSEAEKSFVIYTGDRTLQLIEATCTPNEGFMKYAARVFNKGALEVNEITFGANTDYNSVIQEVWTGSLLPGQILDYPLKSSSKYYTSADFCCVRIDAFNDSLKVQPPDNEICLPLTEQAWFSAAYPTPTNGVVTVDYIFPFADKFSATLCEVDGKVIKNLFTNQHVGSGFGSFTTDISDIRAGMYVIRLSYRDRFFSVKVIKQ